MDVLRDHRRSDLRHDLVGHRVRYNVNRRDRRVMDDRHVNRRSDLQDVDHRLLLDDRHRMGYLCVDDLKLDVKMGVNRGLRMNDRLGGHLMGASRVNRNYARHDRKTDGNLDVSLCLRMNDLLDDRNLDAKMDGNLYPRMNVMDDLNLDASRANRNCALHDQMKDVNLDASRGLHMNDLLDDQSLVDDHRDVPVGHRMNVMDVPNDLMTDGNLDASRGHRMSDLLVDQSSDVSRANRNCVRRDQMTDVNLDAMSHLLMYY